MIIIECNKCHGKMQIEDQYGGQQCQCPTCSAIIDIPSATNEQLSQGPDVSDSDGKPIDDIVEIKCVHCYRIFNIAKKHIGNKIQCPLCEKSFFSLEKNIIQKPKTFAEDVDAFKKKVSKNASAFKTNVVGKVKSINNKFKSSAIIPNPFKKIGLFPSLLTIAFVGVCTYFILSYVFAPTAADVMEKYYYGFYTNGQVVIQVNKNTIVVSKISNPEETTIFYYTPTLVNHDKIQAGVNKIDYIETAQIMDLSQNNVFSHESVKNPETVSIKSVIGSKWVEVTTGLKANAFCFHKKAQPFTSEISTGNLSTNRLFSKARYIYTNPPKENLLDQSEIKKAAIRCDQRAKDAYIKQSLINAINNSSEDSSSIKVFKNYDAIDLIGEVKAIQIPNNDMNVLYAIYNAQSSNSSDELNNQKYKVEFLSNMDSNAFIKLIFDSPVTCHEYYQSLLQQQSEADIRAKSSACIPTAVEKMKMVAKAVRPYKNLGETVEQLVNSGKIPKQLFDNDYPPSAYTLLGEEVKLKDDDIQLVLNAKPLLYNLLATQCSLTPSVFVYSLRNNDQVESKKRRIFSIASDNITTKRVKKITDALALSYLTNGNYDTNYKSTLINAGIKEQELYDYYGNPIHILFPPADINASAVIENKSSHFFSKNQNIRVLAISEPDKLGSVIVGEFLEENFNDDNRIKSVTIKAAPDNFQQLLDELNKSAIIAQKEWNKITREECKNNIERIAIGCIKCYEKNKQFPKSAHDAVYYYNGGRGSKSRYFVPDAHSSEYIVLNKPIGKDNIIVLEPAGIRKSGFWYADFSGNTHLKEFSSINEQIDFQNDLLGTYFLNKSKKQMINNAKTYSRRRSYLSDPFVIIDKHELRFQDSDINIAGRANLEYEILPAPVVSVNSEVKSGTKTKLVLFQPAQAFSCGVLAASDDGTLVWITSKNMDTVPATAEKLPSAKVSLKDRNEIVSKLIAYSEHEVGLFTERKEQKVSEKQILHLLQQLARMNSRGRLPNNPQFINGWNNAKIMPNKKGEYILFLPPLGERKLIMCTSPGVWSEDIQLGFLEKDGVPSIVELVSGVNGKQAQVDYINNLVDKYVNNKRIPKSPSDRESKASVSQVPLKQQLSENTFDKSKAENKPKDVKDPEKNGSPDVNQKHLVNTTDDIKANTLPGSVKQDAAESSASAKSPQIIPLKLRGTELEKKLKIAYDLNKSVLLIIYYRSNLEVRRNPQFLAWINKNVILLEHDTFNGDNTYTSYYNAVVQPTALLLDYNGKLIKEILNYTDVISWINDANKALDGSLKSEESTPYIMPKTIDNSNTTYTTDNEPSHDVGQEFKQTGKNIGREFKNAGKEIGRTFKNLFK